MKVTKGTYINRAILLNKHNLVELVAKMSIYYTNFSFLAFTEDRTELKFDSVDEILAYDNFSKQRICSLVILGKLICSKEENESDVDVYNSDLHIVFLSARCSFEKLSRYGLNYSFSTRSKEAEIILDNFFESFSNRYRLKYSIFCKLLPKFVLFPLFILLIAQIILFFNRDVLPKNLWITTSFVVFLLVAYFVSHLFLWKNVFPPVVFYWGDQINEYSKASKLRNNLLWSALVSFILGLLTSIIMNIIL